MQQSILVTSLVKPGETWKPSEAFSFSLPSPDAGWGSSRIRWALRCSRNHKRIVSPVHFLILTLEPTPAESLLQARNRSSARR